MMITIGITGGVGAGKSTVLDFLEETYQAYVMKADEIGHLVMEPGQSCYEPVIALFGRQIIKNDKTIDRRQVSDVVFSHPELLESRDRRYVWWKLHSFWKIIIRSFAIRYGIFIRMKRSVSGD